MRVHHLVQLSLKIAGFLTVVDWKKILIKMVDDSQLTLREIWIIFWFKIRSELVPEENLLDIKIPREFRIHHFKA